MAPAQHGLFLLTDQAAPAGALHIDFGDRTSTAQVLQHLGQALAFPEWYGANFDALFDCLSDPDAPDYIYLSGLHAYQQRHPDDFATLIEVLRATCEARAEMEAPLIVCVDAATGDIAPWPGQ